MFADKLITMLKCYSRINKFFLVTAFLFIFCQIVNSEKVFWDIGGKSGWNSISCSRNIAFRAGRYGFTGIGLSSKEKDTKNVDMLLTFDKQTSEDSAGFYSVVNPASIYAGHDKSKYGEGALICEALFKEPSIVLKPKENAFFAGGTAVKSFTIEFWLCPENTENGGTVFKWHSSLIDRNSMMYQNIMAQMENNKIEWLFLNIWRRKNNPILDIKLSGKSNLIPGQWSHHLVTYDEDTGLLEYRMNGRSESIIYITETGNENGEILYSMLGVPAEVFIGIGYSGLIDEFKVIRNFEENSLKRISELFEKYEKSGGFFQSEIIDTGGLKSAPKFLYADFDKPAQTDAVFFIRASNSKYNWTTESPAWIPVSHRKKIENVNGRFFQIACNLYPDESGEQSPTIHSLKLEYEKDTFPVPPLRLFVKPGDGEVELSWTPSIDFDVKGYLVFVGDRKGQYFLKNSPIDAGNSLQLKICNLENGKLYFFSVAAYDDNGIDGAGPLSKEIWARPLRCP